METLLDDVSDAAYDKAVEVVTDTVRQETHKEDIRLIEETKTWVLSPERKAPQKERDYAAARLDGVINKIKRVMQHALAKIQRTLMQPEVKQAGKEQVKKKAKESIMDMLAKTKINADRDNRERWEREGRIAPTKEQDMSCKASDFLRKPGAFFLCLEVRKSNVFEAVKQAVPTRQAAESYGVQVGRNGMACCPFHDDKHPSMKVDRRFHCFGCQADGI